MRAQENEGRLGRRFAIVIGMAAAGVMVLGAQTTAAAPEVVTAAPDVVKYRTLLTITTERGFLYHGWVQSDRDRNPVYDPATAVRECMEGRRVTLFKKLPGADRTITTLRSHFVPRYGQGDWGMPEGPHSNHARMYATVTPKVGDGFVCSAARSPTI